MGRGFVWWHMPLPVPVMPLVAVCPPLFLFVISRVRRFLQRRATQASYRALASAKRSSVATALASARAAGLDWVGLVRWTATHSPASAPDAVLQLPARELCSQLSSGRLSSEYVTRVFVAQTIKVDESLHCVAEQCFELAVKEAKKCDVERAEGRLRGSLHGLPISVKEQMRMSGFQTTCGACCRLMDPPAQDTAVLVTLLKQAGAIPFVRTNVPQLLMLPETFVRRGPCPPPRAPASLGQGPLARRRSRAACAC